MSKKLWILTFSPFLTISPFTPPNRAIRYRAGARKTDLEPRAAGRCPQQALYRGDATVPYARGKGAFVVIKLYRQNGVCCAPWMPQNQPTRQKVYREASGDHCQATKHTRSRQGSCWARGRLRGRSSYWHSTPATMARGGGGPASWDACCRGREVGVSRCRQCCCYCLLCLLSYRIWTRVLLSNRPRRLVAQYQTASRRPA